MRPICPRERISSVSSSFNPGLSLSRSVVYNDQQKLPLSGRVPTEDHGSSPTFEAAMKPARPDQSSTNPRSTEPKPSGNASVETRAQRLERIKREIQDGVYDTDDKMEQAIERMLGVLMDS